MFLVEWKTPDMNYYETTPAVFTTMNKAKDYCAKTSFSRSEWIWEEDATGEEITTKAGDTTYFITKVKVDPESK